MAPPYYVRALALGIPALLLGLQISGWIHFVPAIIDGHADFRQLYTAGVMLRSGARANLYDYATQKEFEDRVVSPADIALPFDHLAYEAVLFLPFSLLPFHSAYVAFLCMNLGAAVVAFRMLRPRLQNLESVVDRFPVFLFACYLPLAACLMQGQDSIFLLVLLMLAYSDLREERQFRAGVLTGLGLFKFQIVIPIAIVMLLARRKKFTAGFSVSALLMGTASLCITGISGMENYLGMLLKMSVKLSSSDAQFRYGTSPLAMANLRGLLSGIIRVDNSHLMIQVLTFVLSAAILVWTASKVSNVSSSSDALLVCIICAVFVSYHVLIHDLTVLILPIAVFLNRYLLSEDSGPMVERRASWAAAAMFAAPIFVVISASVFFLTAIPVFVFLVVSAHACQIPISDKRLSDLQTA